MYPNQHVCDCLAGGARGAFTNAVRSAVVAVPTLQRVDFEANVFEAYWLGTSSRNMGGQASFAIGTTAAAPAASPVGGEPTFTG